MAVVSFMNMALAGVSHEMNGNSGGIIRLGIDGDPNGMNWVLRPDGTQYPWVGGDSAWGLGGFTLASDKEKVSCKWNVAETIENGKIVYRPHPWIRVEVVRQVVAGDLVESYTFQNVGKVISMSEEEVCELQDIAINTPFNDNYPDAATCVASRCNAHVWPGGDAAYVCAVRMGGDGPHLGLQVTDGSVSGYEIRERGYDRGMSNFRGVIALRIPDVTLAPGDSCRVAWRVFEHKGWDDFFENLKAHGGVVAFADRYVAQVGESVSVSLADRSGEIVRREVTIDEPGEKRVEFRYGEDGRKKTHVELLAISDYKELIRRRADFIVRHQQLNDKENPRDGAYLAYDNYNERRYQVWKDPIPRIDFDEGRERANMGVFLSEAFKRGERLEGRLEPSLVRYGRFVRNVLQDPDYKTWSELCHTNWFRVYNYPWQTRYYLNMFEATHGRQYLIDAYRTQRAAYRDGGYGFYMIDVPVVELTRILKAEGMNEERSLLMDDYRQAAEVFLKNGLEVPEHEVHFEQTILAPACTFLIEMFRVTGEVKYKVGAARLLKAVEAFNGRQPSWHLNDIAIRHWDGYWGGHNYRFGDTMPHYWSCVTADCFAQWSLATGDARYQNRAKTILRQNLGCFFEDGRATTCWVYPDAVNGVRGKYADPAANDQDYALAYYLRWLGDDVKAMPVREEIIAGGITNGTSYAHWTVNRLEVGNEIFSRVLVPGEKGLETISLKVRGKEILRPGRPETASCRSGRFASVAASAEPLTQVGSPGVGITVSTAGWTETISLAKGMDGLVREAGKVDFRFLASGDVWADMPREDASFRDGADTCTFVWPHAKVVAYELRDQTDVNDEKVFVREYLPTTLGEPLRLKETVAAVEDTLTGDGVAFVRLAPLPAARPDGLPDYAFNADGHYLKFAPVRNGWPVAEVVYAGGAQGRISALRGLQRAIRAYRPERDGLLLSNTWGDGNADSRITAAFVAAEIKAGAAIGVDVVQIDDGWQSGKSGNSKLLAAGEKGKWGNFRDNASFWDIDVKRFPQGLGPLVALARENGIELGLWFGPESSNDCAAWNEDAETLLAFYRNYGIRYFKIDSLMMSSRAAFANQRKMFDRLLGESGGAIVSDFDVTGVAKRPGYFGLGDVGPIFLENRMWQKGHYWPHQTLRSLWSLAEIVDPVRLRVEFLNPHHGADEYPAESPLAPVRYRADALFAMTMVASPLAWMELSELDAESVGELKPVVAVWKRHRARLHAGVTYPIGAKPDGVSWTGFATRAADGEGGYAILFRELNPLGEHAFDLRDELPDASMATVLAGNGGARMENGKLIVNIPGQLDYLWLQIR